MSVAEPPSRPRRWLTQSPGIDEHFSVARYVAHLARSSFVATRHPPPRPRLRIAASEIGVTFIGHATVLIEIDGVTILTDPVLSERLFVVKRLVSPGLPQGGLPAIDVVLVSHAHHDHLDVATHRRLPKRDTIAVVSRNLGDLLSRSGYARIVELGWEEQFEHKGVRITALAVNHWGTRGLLPDRRGYGGFLVEGASGAVFFPGDTAYTPLFREYGRRFSIDVAVLPIGAYRPASFRRVHMNPEDALQAFLDLRASFLVPVHWGTFDLSYEPPDEPPRWIRQLAADAGLEARLALLGHGEGRVFRGRNGERPR
ncbi:MAG: MBL fold metallo-hydrolase [Deltaproteobacteria bacterium]|nr:MBL fold metallo-hydrolase [Deltaproteobacteria bacterium]